MTLTPEHLIIAPILIPFFAGALMLLYGDEKQRKARLVISFGSAAALRQHFVRAVGTAPLAYRLTFREAS